MLSNNDLPEVLNQANCDCSYNIRTTSENAKMINGVLRFLDTNLENDIPESVPDQMIDLLTHAIKDMDYASEIADKLHKDEPSPSPVDDYVTAFVNEINHPAHYMQYKGVEVIDITESLPFGVGNAIKYLLRAGHKKGTTRLTDLRKCLWYVDRSIESGIVTDIYNYNVPNHAKLIHNCQLVYDQIPSGLVKTAYSHILTGEMEAARECLVREIEYEMEARF